jgi:hypothetical protein
MDSLAIRLALKDWAFAIAKRRGSVEIAVGQKAMTSVLGR